MRTSSPIVVRLVTSLLVSAAVATPARAQDPHAGMQHEHGASSSGWQLMQDGVVFLMFNRQGGPRGDTEWKAPNWWMGMGRHRARPGTFSFTLMLSLDPATVGAAGYSEIFQVGETFRGDPLIDRQHPHDFLMQASASWRVPLRGAYMLTLAGAPVGGPALGPVAFMHRLSSCDNPVAPLGHHTFDSTHIAMGVLTGAIERGPLQVESSLFNGREPDEQRWDLMDPGALDSWSVRGWYRPSASWAAQVSHGYLTNPEASEEGNVRRTTATVSWTPRRDRGWRGVTAGWGLNNKLGGAYNALLFEGSYGLGATTLYGRAEYTQVDRRPALRRPPSPRRTQGRPRRSPRRDRLRVGADDRRDAHAGASVRLGVGAWRRRDRVSCAVGPEADARQSSRVSSHLSLDPSAVHAQDDGDDDESTVE